MAKIIPFTGITNLDINPKVVLDNIPELEGVVIAGYGKNGEEFFASSYADGGTILWLLERLKIKLLAVPEHEMFQGD